MPEVEVRDEIFGRIKQRVEETEFGSVDEYINFVLREVLSELEEDFEGAEMDEADEEKVKDRLRSLGYMD